MCVCNDTNIWKKGSADKTRIIVLYRCLYVTCLKINIMFNNGTVDHRRVGIPQKPVKISTYFITSEVHRNNIMYLSLVVLYIYDLKDFVRSITLHGPILTSVRARTIHVFYRWPLRSSLKIAVYSFFINNYCTYRRSIKIILYIIPSRAVQTCLACLTRVRREAT